MENKQHINEKDTKMLTPVLCLNCNKEWIAVYPEKTRVDLLECPECEEQGYTVEQDKVNFRNCIAMKHKLRKKIHFLKAHPLCVGCQQHGYYRKATSVYWTSEEEGIALCEYHYEEITTSGIPDEIVTWKTSEVLSVLNKNTGI